MNKYDSNIMKEYKDEIFDNPLASRNNYYNYFYIEN